MAFRENGEGIRINTEYKREELEKIHGMRWGGGDYKDVTGDKVNFVVT